MENGKVMSDLVAKRVAKAKEDSRASLGEGDYVYNLMVAVDDVIELAGEGLLDLADAVAILKAIRHINN